MQGVPPAPRGVPQIEVTFDIDANGIVHVSSKDKATGKEQSISIQSSGGLSETEINDMINNAEKMKDADAKKREMVDLKNEGDNALHTTQKSLDEHRSKLKSEHIEEIEKEMTELRTIMADSSVTNEALKEQINKVKEATMKIGQNLYANTQDSQDNQEQQQDNQDNTQDNKEEDKKDNKQ